MRRNLIPALDADEVTDGRFAISAASTKLLNDLPKTVGTVDHDHDSHGIVMKAEAERGGRRHDLVLASHKGLKIPLLRIACHR